MIYRSWTGWPTLRQKMFDELKATHTAVAGDKPGRKYATQQINQAYVVVLSSQLQAFSRDLRTEAPSAVAGSYATPAVVTIAWVNWRGNGPLSIPCSTAAMKILAG